MKHTVRGATVIKTTIALPEETLALLQEFAEQRNASYAEVVGHALAVEKYLRTAREDGCHVLIEDRNKQIRELVLF
jgi:hypothetical protein